MTGVNGGPWSLSAAREFSSDSSESFGVVGVWVKGDVGTRHVIGTSEWT